MIIETINLFGVGLNYLLLLLFSLFLVIISIFFLPVTLVTLEVANKCSVRIGSSFWRVLTDYNQLSWCTEWNAVNISATIILTAVWYVIFFVLMLEAFRRMRK